MLYVAFRTVQYFSTLPHKRQDFRKKKVKKHKYVYFDFLYNFEAFLTVGRTKKDMVRNVYWLFMRREFFFLQLFERQ